MDGAEVRLRHKVLVGAVARGRACLGSLEIPRYDKAQERERCQLIQEEIGAGVEEKRIGRTVAVRQHGA